MPNLYKFYFHTVLPPAAAAAAVALIPASLSYPLRSRTQSRRPCTFRPLLLWPYALRPLSYALRLPLPLRSLSHV